MLTQTKSKKKKKQEKEKMKYSSVFRTKHFAPHK